MNFKEIATDLEGPVIVPEEEVPVKPVKQEKKFFDFFKKKKKVSIHSLFQTPTVESFLFMRVNVSWIVKIWLSHWYIIHG